MPAMRTHIVKCLQLPRPITDHKHILLMYLRCEILPGLQNLRLMTHAPPIAVKDRLFLKIVDLRVRIKPCWNCEGIRRVHAELGIAFP